MNVICGLPRSGSTLLCNLLNQNPRFFATSTSVLPALCGSLVCTWSGLPEVRAGLHADRENGKSRLRRSLKAFCAAWHDQPGKVVFDKSRGWLWHLLLLREAWPESKVVVVVRDPRNVFASVEKQHRRTALIDEAQKPEEKALRWRLHSMFDAGGLIGRPLAGIRDLLDRQLPASFVRYEDLAGSPQQEMRRLYEGLEEEHFSHNFSSVENTATDPDWLYANKYPHVGAGPVALRPLDEWKLYMTSSVADEITARTLWFATHFGYLDHDDRNPRKQFAGPSGLASTPA